MNPYQAHSHAGLNGDPCEHCLADPRYPVWAEIAGVAAFLLAMWALLLGCVVLLVPAQ